MDNDAQRSPRGLALKRESMPPAAIVAAIAAGNRDAESALVEKYGPALRYILRREVRDWDCADDLYQESFRITLERLRDRGLEQPDQLAAFLLGVARRLVKAHRRTGVRVVASSDSSETVADSAPTPLELAIRSEQATSVWAAIERLDVPRDRELLRRYLLDEDKETICNALGMGVHQFNKTLCRARRRLRRQLDNAAGPGAAQSDQEALNHCDDRRSDEGSGREAGGALPAGPAADSRAQESRFGSPHGVE